MKLILKVPVIPLEVPGKHLGEYPVEFLDKVLIEELLEDLLKIFPVKHSVEVPVDLLEKKIRCSSSRNSRFWRHSGETSLVMTGEPPRRMPAKIPPDDLLIEFPGEYQEKFHEKTPTVIPDGTSTGILGWTTLKSNKKKILWNIPEIAPGIF